MSKIDHINPSYINHLQTLGSIPKLFHVSWPNKTVLDSKTMIIEYGLRAFTTLNPDWTIIIYNDTEIEQYLREKLSVFDYGLIKNRHIIEKIDLWRLLIIYFKGGLYADIDRMFTIPMHQIITDKIKILLPTHYDINFAQDFLCSAPFNSLFKLAIELNISKRRIYHAQDLKQNILARWIWNGGSDSNFKMVIELGPVTYWEAATNSLFNLTLPYYEVTMPGIRKLVNDSEYMMTCKEEWCDTLVYHTSDMEFCKSITSEELWFETNHKKHWESEVRQTSWI